MIMLISTLVIKIMIMLISMLVIKIMIIIKMVMFRVAIANVNSSPKKSRFKNLSSDTEVVISAEAREHCTDLHK